MDFRIFGRRIRPLEAILIIIAAALIFRAVRGFGISTYKTYKNADKYTAGNFSYDADPIRSVVIDWVDEDVTISVSDSSRLSVSENGTRLKERQQLHWRIDGSTLTIRYCKSGLRGRIPGGTKKLYVEVPEGVSLTVNTVSSDVLLEGSGPFRKMDFNTVSGSITAGSVTAEKISVDTVSGDITMGFADIDKADLNTVSGNLTLTELPSDGAVIDFSSISGTVLGSDFTKDQNKYTFGRGGTKISVSTVSGNLMVQ